MAEYLFRKVKTKVNSIDSAIVFREIKKDLLVYNKLDDDVENIFGFTLHREEESIVNYNGLEMFYLDYIHNSINKYFNITIVEYLNLTRPERITMNKVAKDKMIEEQKIIDDMKAKAKTQNNHPNVMYDDMNFK